MRVKLLLCIALILFSALSVFGQDKTDEVTDNPILIGAWDVNFSLSGLGQQRLTFLAYPDKRGTFQLRVRSTLQPNVSVPATWDKITTTTMNFSGEIQIPIGNFGRETGTLIFKGQIGSNQVITGQVILVTNTPDSTNPTGFVTRTGIFTATPLPIVAMD